MRVLVLCEFTTLNGGERSLLAVVPEVRARGFELLVACPKAGPLVGALHELEVPHLPLAFHGLDGGRLSQIAAREAIDQLVTATRADLVHANSVSISRLAGPVVQARGIPNLGHLRDMLGLSRQALADVACHDALLAVSQATRDWYVAAGLDRNQLHVLYNGVDLEQYRPRRRLGWLPAELGLANDARLIGAIGQIGMRKGLDVVLAAFRSVTAVCPDTHLVLIGQRHSQKQEARDYEQQLRVLAAAPPLGGRVHWLGGRSDVPRILNELAVLVHAARQEPLGRVLLEAAAAGVPIIATDVGGTREIFPDPEQGAVLIPADSADRLAESLLGLLANGARCRELGQAARARIERQFDARVAAVRLAEQYRQTLERRNH